jgi:hypothetical protein
VYTFIILSIINHLCNHFIARHRFSIALRMLWKHFYCFANALSSRWNAFYRFATARSSPRARLVYRLRMLWNVFSCFANGAKGLSVVWEKNINRFQWD